ncbi:hypothetical protein BSKO_04545 [Bryopsis sp. KO-2023]|nr:hypothetical protein BSKO_04545 [Bryopsis sp. KO-2023]
MVQCKRQCQNPKSGNPEHPLVVVGLPPIGGVASSASPFVGKVDLFCKMAGITYSLETNFGGAGPKGKIPYIRHGDNVLGDSTFIIEYLKNTYGDLTKALEPKTPRDKATAIACQRICEDHLYYGLIHFRFVDQKGYDGTTKFLGGLGLIPQLLKPIAFRAARKGIRNTLFTQGLGRHQVEEMKSLLSSSVEALSGFLGDQDYMLGAEPSEADAIVFSTLDNFLNDGNPTAMPELVREFPNLVDYVQRIKDRFYNSKGTTSVFEN